MKTENKIILVFGCGGDRDPMKRPIMGKIGTELADIAIITSDNPRFEEPEEIMNDIETGMQKTYGEYIKIADRKEAIRYAILNARAGDIIVVLRLRVLWLNSRSDQQI